MSTTETMFENDELEEFASILKEWPNSVWGDDEQRLGVSPFLTFYFLYDTKRWVDTSLILVEIHEEFARLTGQPYKVATHPTSERPHPYGSKRIPDLKDFARKSRKDKSFLFSVTNEKNHRSSPAHGGYFWKKADYMNDREPATHRIYSSIQLYYRWSWWKENRNAWRAFVIDTIEKLRPEVVYSGFALATPLAFGTRSDVTVWERALAPRFYGLDIDDPWAMDQIGDGLRPPTWGFFLDDVWRNKLEVSREQVKDHLHHPDISIVDLSTGLWIELGAEPSLYPHEDGVPALPALMNKLIRPIRDDNIDLLGFPQWDGDPNERFNHRDSRRWLQRFDDESDWPSVEQRRTPPPNQVAMPDRESAELRAKAGDVCPKSGTWESLDERAQRQHFEHGESMPSLTTSYGLTVWRYAGV